MPVIQPVEITHAGGWKELHDTAWLLRLVAVLLLAQLIATIVLINVIIAHVAK